MKLQDNPLIEAPKTPFGIPPFKDIKPEHFIPALSAAIASTQSEINRIAKNPDSPSFENTIEALESCGKDINRIALILFNLNSAETNSKIQKVTQEASPILTRFSNDITLNKDLFKRIKHVYNNTDRAALSTEETILLKDRYLSFRNGGAELEGDKRKIFRDISEELSELTLKFEENLLAETNSFELHLTQTDELDGLPEGIIDAAAEEATAREKDGWVFTLNAPSYIPFMQYSSKRKLREHMFRAYSSRCYNNNDYDNRVLVLRIVNLRLELAKILGFECYADLILEERMANSRSKVNTFLDNIYKEAYSFALKDFKTVEDFARDKGFNHPIQKWDWAYYAEWLKRDLHSIDDEVLRPYFKLENVEKAVFNLASLLFGLSFKLISDSNAYHKDVKTYEVADSNGNHISVLMTDFHPRKGKSGGAWMTSYREQYRGDKAEIRPIVSIVMNFSKPSSKRPSLLTHNEVTTLLHEFGHALHGMLSKCKYESNSGTSVKRDFVELPSQIMENYAFEKEWLTKWAHHYLSGEIIPDELITKIKDSHTYNEGYACNRQLSFAMLDMDWHSITTPITDAVNDFENRSMQRTDIFPPVEGVNMSCAFGHLFSGGYAAGYYGYKWAEVLDADAFSVFQKNGIFDLETASRFRKSILEKGGSDDPSKLYKDFRGSEPSIRAFLKRSGFVN